MEFSPRYHHTADMLQTEQHLIEAAKQNPEHFGPLYDKYYKQIFGYIYQRMDCKDSAFDLTSQVFLKALTNIEKYEYKGVPLSIPRLRRATSLSELQIPQRTRPFSYEVFPPSHHGTM